MKTRYKIIIAIAPMILLVLFGMSLKLIFGMDAINCEERGGTWDGIAKRCIETGQWTATKIPLPIQLTEEGCEEMNGFVKYTSIVPVPPTGEQLDYDIRGLACVIPIKSTPTAEENYDEFATPSTLDEPHTISDFKNKIYPEPTPVPEYIPGDYTDNYDCGSGATFTEGICIVD